jgi:hypothetical protein
MRRARSARRRGRALDRPDGVVVVDAVPTMFPSPLKRTASGAEKRTHFVPRGKVRRGALLRPSGANRSEPIMVEPLRSDPTAGLFILRH